MASFYKDKKDASRAALSIAQKAGSLETPVQDKIKAHLLLNYGFGDRTANEIIRNLKVLIDGKAS